jgi:hypothetical protein
VEWSFESFTGGPQVTAPGLGFNIRQFGFGQNFGEIEAGAYFFGVRLPAHKISLSDFALVSTRLTARRERQICSNGPDYVWSLEEIIALMP